MYVPKPVEFVHFMTGSPSPGGGGESRQIKVPPVFETTEEDLWH